MRLSPPVAVLATGTELGSTRTTTRHAVAVGAITQEDADRSGVQELPVETERSAPELAVDAATKVLAEAGRRGDEVDLVLHAWTHFQGHEFWSPAHYVADGIGASDAHCLGIQQMCHGGVGALEVAASRLAADPTVRTVVVTTADRFDERWFDRWSGDYGVLYGDGATACVLQRDVPDAPGAGRPRARVHSVVSASIPTLEAMHRDTGAFRTAPEVGHKIDVRATKKAYLRRHGSAALKDSFDRALRSVVPRAIREAQIAPEDVDRVVLPRVGAAVVDDMYAPALADLVPADRLHQPDRSGHLGAGDLFANLADAADVPFGRGRRYRVYITAGAGFTVSACVVEHLENLEHAV